MNKNLELEDVERWTLEQIAKEKTGGCMEQAKIWAKDLVMVDHESPSLHALGHRQFIVTNTKRRKIHGTEELAGTTKEAGMSNQAHQACAAELATAMESSGSNAGGGGGGRGGGGSKTVSKVVPPPPGLNAEELKAHEEKMAKIKKEEEEKARCTEAKKAMMKEVGKLKTFVDKVKADARAGTVEINRMVARGMPDTTVNWCTTMLATHETYLNPSDSSYVEILNKIPDLATVPEFDAVGQSAKDIVLKFEDQHKQFKQGILAHIQNQNKSNLTLPSIPVSAA